MSTTTTLTLADAANRVDTLAQHLGCTPQEIEQTEYDEALFEVDGGWYLVLTSDEATARALDNAEESLWAFRSGYLAEYMPEGITAAILAPIQDKLCENAQPAIRAMLGARLQECLQDAIATDGREHFLSTYDGEEHEVEGLFIYRTD